ncbi:hypothetical protein F4827_004409 [Paraburkholderia bannensis]|uniref:Uncharacterized protein n=1 Tax=Paraburkholderia bannensis TaxID=765414 RepID=A0A7W9WSQ9_9BURK|nr:MULTISPECIES: hypothetical protein [Paraburkholderia]MBB3259534.1 hypothetical protein [Paraburkholderia sp. WP4_3_2]MBB6104550.1 hypothetical protein [Paraburkholderia bannensis]
MNDTRKKNPTFGVGVMIVVVVLIVIGTVLFNALRSKREYDATVGAQTSSAASGVAASAAQARGAAQ